MKNLSTLIGKWKPAFALILVCLLTWNLCTAQGDDFHCLLNEPFLNGDGCDYTEVPNNVKTQSLVVNGNGELIMLGYCATQQDVIDAFMGWFDNLIDPETDCSEIKIETVEVPGGDVGPEILVNYISGQSYLWDIGGTVNPFSNTPGQIYLPKACTGGYYKYEITISADCGRQAQEIKIVNFYLRVYPFPEAETPAAVTLSLADLSASEILTSYQNWVDGFFAGPEFLLIDLEPDAENSFPSAIYPTWGGCISPGHTFTGGRLTGFGATFPIYSANGCNLDEDEFACFQRQMKDGLSEVSILQNDEIKIFASVDQTGQCTEHGSSFTITNPNPVACEIVVNEVSDALRPACQSAAFYEMQFRNFINGFGYNEADMNECGVTVEETFQRAKVPVPASGDLYELYDPNSFSGEDFTCGEEITIWYRASNAATRQGPAPVVAKFSVADVNAVTLSCPPDIEIMIDPCNDDTSPAVTGAATATHGCTVPTITYADQLTNSEPCGGDYTITRTWTATALCGNATSCDQVITVTNDISGPALSCPADVELVLDGLCSADTSASQTGMAMIADPCPGTILSRSDEVIVPCSGTMIITRTWTAIDACGNANTCDQLITVLDETNPTISNFGNVELFLDGNCFADTSALSVGIPTATDHCTRKPTLVHEDEVQAQCGSGYDINRTWTATDACGNLTSRVQVIQVRDNAGPDITCPSDVVLFLDAFGRANPSVSETGMASANDNCSADQDVTITHNDQPSYDCGSSYRITRIWTATDACGNVSTCDQVITVRDTISPIIICPLPVQLYTDQGCTVDTSANATGFASATDNSQQVVIHRNDEVEAPCDGAMIITRIWTAVDPCGNSRSCEQVIVVSDTTSPTISCPTRVDLGCNPEVPLALPVDVTMVDPCSTPQVTVQQGQPTSTDGYFFQREDTYTATDDCGNSSSCSRILTWKEDRTAPVIYGVPDNISISCLETLPKVAPNVTAQDNIDGEVVPTFAEEVFDVSCGGMMVRRSWTVVDACGNRSSEQQIISFTDNVAPLLLVPADTMVELGEAVPRATHQVVDQCSDVRVSMEEIKTEVNSGEYSLQRVWTARDACGNTAHARQLIQVEDHTPPVITLVNPMLIDVPNGGIMEVFDCTDPAVAMADALVTDANNEVELITFDKLVASNVCSVFGYYRRWKCGYIATDGAGNEAEYSFTVYQYDTTAPTLQGVPSDVAASCADDEFATLTDVTAADACQGNVPVEFGEIQLLNPSDSNQSALIRTWTASDGCGNRAEASQSITYCGFDLEMAASTLGNRVWLDTNLNGLQDEEEQGVDDVRINLYWIDPTGVQSPRLIDSIWTYSKDDRSGQFVFEYLFPGQYQIEIDLPHELILTNHQVGDRDSLDSDILIETSMSAIIELDTNAVLDDVDAGLVPDPSLAPQEPLKLFTGSAESCHNWLIWETNEEEGMALIELQSSAPGEQFQTIERIQPMGGKQGARYRTEDMNPSDRTRYRLKMVRQDAVVDYSSIISIDQACAPGALSALIIYPNPTNHSSTVQFEIDRSTKVQMRVLDHLGRIILQKDVFTHKGEYVRQIDLGKQPDGIYWLQINSGIEFLTRKIVKTN